jgi:hypothetical protein
LVLAAPNQPFVADAMILAALTFIPNDSGAAQDYSPSSQVLRRTI